MEQEYLIDTNVIIDYAIIAASAISIGATLITSDLADFSKVTSLRILEPHNIK